MRQAVLTAVLALVAILIAVPVQAAAAPPPAAGSTVVASAAPLGPMAGTLSFEVSALTPEIVTDRGPVELTISGTVTNTGEATADEMISRIQRGSAIRNTAALNAEINDPGQPIEVIPEEFSELPGTLTPGASMPFTVTAPLVGPADGSLQINRPGIYPILVNINGRLTSDTENEVYRIGELHLLLTVTSVPTVAVLTPLDQAPTSDSGVIDATGSASLTAAAAEVRPTSPVRMNLVWPLVDRPHMDPLGSFLDDDLAASVSDGGRLELALEAVEQAAPPDGTVTLAVDPELLDELDRMSGGYTVGPGVLDLAAIAAEVAADTEAGLTAPATSESSAAPTSTPASSAPKNTGTGRPTSAESSPELATVDPSEPTRSVGGSAAPGPTTDPTADETTDPEVGKLPVPTADQRLGTGQAAATAYLDRLRVLAGRYQVLVLPYGDPDLVALTRSGLNTVLGSTITKGRQVAERVLGESASPGTGPVNDIAWPVNGQIDQATAEAVQLAGIDSILIDPSNTDARRTAGLTPTSSGSVRVAVSDRILADRVAALISGQPGADSPITLNRLVAQLAQYGLGNTGRNVVITAPRQLQANPQALTRWMEVVSTLDQDGVLTGTALSAVAGSTESTIALEYPATAQAAEISSGALRYLTDLQQLVTSLDQTMVVNRGETTTPIGVLAPLAANLITGAAASFRGDPTGLARWAQPVNRALDSLRAQVAIVPPVGSYTLTSTTSPLSVSVRNDLPFEVRIKIDVVNAGLVGLEVPAPADQLVPASRPSKQIELDAKVNKAGKFLVQVQILTPDGTVWGTRTTLQLTSTAYGSFTIWLMITAGVVLLVTIAWRIRQRWHKRLDRLQREAAESEPAPEPAEKPTADDGDLSDPDEGGPDEQSAPASGGDR